MNTEEIEEIVNETERTIEATVTERYGREDDIPEAIRTVIRNLIATLQAKHAEELERAVLESKISEHKPRLELWNEAVEEGRRRERSFIMKLIDGHKVVYKKGDERFYEDAEDGDEKDHIDSCCNETLDEILQALTPTKTDKQ